MTQSKEFSFRAISSYYPRERAVRRWKGDGSENEMSLAAAACNLAHNNGGVAWKIARRLKSGDAMETKLAEFKVV